MASQINRRAFLSGACCLAASPLVTPVSFAAMPGENRLVTIILRGGMDGLSLVQPYGDPALRLLRPKLALGADDGLLDLDGFFGLHPAAKALLPLWNAGELGFLHATSTPYRNERSHFDGQDILESGGAAVQGERTGWLNRAIASIPQPADRRAIDINATAELILSGDSPVDVWSTRADLALAEDEQAFFVQLYRNDPAFAAALGEAMVTDMLSDRLYGTEKRSVGTQSVAKFAAGMLSTDYRIASFSITGWDTHLSQSKIFLKPVDELVTAITTLKANLSPVVWRKTAILAITEFGRTARENGSQGTDHGTGGLAVLAGGAVAGGKVYRDWPSLSDSDLLDGRDLRPTTDLRQLAAAMLRQQFGISARDLETAVFPGLSFDRHAAYLRG